VAAAWQPAACQASAKKLALAGVASGIETSAMKA